MKNIIKTSVLSLIIGGSLVSCNDFLTIDPIDKPVLETYYTTPAALQSTTMALYASKTWSNFHMNFQWKLDMINGDIYYTYSDEGQWYFGTYTSVNPYLNEGWKGIYNVILDANSIIHDIVPICGGTITQADKDQALGEARAMRGYCHYMLAEVWHDVPVIENNTEMISSGNLDVPRNTQASVYRFAMEDLDAAVELLPEETTDNYRLNKRKARALRAKLAVTMAAHKDYGYDRDALYAKAAADALDVIENTQALTQIDFSTLFDVEANNGPESILAIQCGVLGYSYGNARNTAWSRSSVIADQTWGQDTAPSFPANGANYRQFPTERPPLVPKPQQLRWDGRVIPVQSVRILAPSPSKTSYPEQMKFIVSELKSFLADHRVKVAPDGTFAIKFVKGDVKTGTENSKLKEEAYSLRVTSGGALITAK